MLGGEQFSNRVVLLKLVGHVLVEVKLESTLLFCFSRLLFRRFDHIFVLNRVLKRDRVKFVVLL